MPAIIVKNLLFCGKFSIGKCFALLRTIVLCAAVLAACKGSGGEKVWSPGQPLAKEKVIIGVIYVSDPRTETSGYSYAHYRGIEEMRRAARLTDAQIQGIYNLDDTNKVGIESAIRYLIARGINIVIATSWGYMDACEKLAVEFPNVIFAHCSGYKSNAANFTNYFGRIYQAWYLSGIAAGLKTKTGKIGYVAAMGKDSSAVTSGINAFALGVERANPAARIYVNVLRSWFDPIGESSTARELIDAGCDVIAQYTDTANPQIQAERAGVWGIGYNSDMHGEAPDAVLCSVVWNWEAYYTQLIKSIINGSFTTAPYFGGIADGMVDITSLAQGIIVPGTAERVSAERWRIIEGDFNVFDGELLTNDGRIIGTTGKTLSDDEIQSGINWYYHTVVAL